MALKTLVKVGEITSLSDARYCAGMGVDMLGFNLNPESEAYVSPEQFKAITDWVSGVRLVGEFGNIDSSLIDKALEQYQLDMIQITPTNLELNIDLPIILEMSESKDIQDVSNPEKIEFFLASFSDQSFIEAASQFPVLLAGDLGVEEVVDLIDTTSIRGIALKGSLEEKPGFKDYDQLADILEALEIDD